MNHRNTRTFIRFLANEFETIVEAFWHRSALEARGKSNISQLRIVRTYDKVDPDDLLFLSDMSWQEVGKQHIVTTLSISVKMLSA